MGNWNNYSYVNTTPSNSVPYAKSFMMDRNVGAFDTNHPAPADRGVLHYSAGSHIPFPRNTLYNISGVALTATAPAGFAEQRWNNSNANYAGRTSSTVNYVIHPLTLYTLDYDPVIGLWNDGMLLNTNNISKSVFDPCPAGWHMANAGWSDDFVIPNINANGVETYWPNGIPNPNNDRIYYRLCGLRNVGNYGWITADVGSSLLFNYLANGLKNEWDYSNNTFSTNSTAKSLYSGTIRCVSMP